MRNPGGISSVMRWIQLLAKYSSFMGRPLTLNINSFLQALEIQPTNVVWWNKVGNLALRKLSNLQLARECFEEAIKIEPNNFVALDNLAIVRFSFAVVQVIGW
jgi:tetratricopeptide (TPR) repeat protein